MFNKSSIIRSSTLQITYTANGHTGGVSVGFSTLYYNDNIYTFPCLQHAVSSYYTYYIVYKLSYFITGIMTISGSHTLLNFVRLKNEVNLFSPFMSNITHD